MEAVIVTQKQFNPIYKTGKYGVTAQTINENFLSNFVEIMGAFESVLTDDLPDTTDRHKADLARFIVKKSIFKFYETYVRKLSEKYPLYKGFDSFADSKEPLAVLQKDPMFSAFLGRHQEQVSTLYDEVKTLRKITAGSANITFVPSFSTTQQKALAAKAVNWDSSAPTTADALKSLAQDNGLYLTDDIINGMNVTGFKKAMVVALSIFKGDQRLHRPVHAYDVVEALATNRGEHPASISSTFDGEIIKKGFSILPFPESNRHAMTIVTNAGDYIAWDLTNVSAVQRAKKMGSEYKLALGSGYNELLELELTRSQMVGPPSSAKSRSLSVFGFIMNLCIIGTTKKNDDIADAITSISLNTMTLPIEIHPTAHIVKGILNAYYDEVPVIEDFELFKLYLLWADGKGSSQRKVNDAVHMHTSAISRDAITFPKRLSEIIEEDEGRAIDEAVSTYLGKQVLSKSVLYAPHEGTSFHILTLPDAVRKTGRIRLEATNNLAFIKDVPVSRPAFASEAMLLQRKRDNSIVSSVDATVSAKMVQDLIRHSPLGDSTITIDLSVDAIEGSIPRKGEPIHDFRSARVPTKRLSEVLPSIAIPPEVDITLIQSEDDVSEMLLPNLGLPCDFKSIHITTPTDRLTFGHFEPILTKPFSAKLNAKIADVVSLIYQQQIQSAFGELVKDVTYDVPYTPTRLLKRLSLMEQEYSEYTISKGVELFFSHPIARPTIEGKIDTRLMDKILNDSSYSMFGLNDVLVEVYSAVRQRVQDWVIAYAGSEVFDHLSKYLSGELDTSVIKSMVERPAMGLLFTQLVEEITRDATPETTLFTIAKIQIYVEVIAEAKNTVKTLRTNKKLEPIEFPAVRVPGEEV